MTALNDRRSPVIPSDPLMEFGEIASIALGDQNMGGASQVFWWFPERPAWKEVLISEGGFTVDEDQIKATVQPQVLKTIIQNQEVTSE
jgi:hypothetical protein